VITSRCHEVIKAFASYAEGLDLMLTGKLVAAVKTGKKAEVSFAAWIVMERTTKGLKMKLYEAWSVSWSL
jgi:hypothetical protein